MTVVPGVPINVSFQINSSVNGTQIYELIDNRNDPDGYLSFRIASSSTLENFQTVEFKLNAEEGFIVDQDGMRLSLEDNTGVLLSNGTVTVGVNPSGYVVSNPSAFRAAINFELGVSDYFAAIYARTTNPAVLGMPWNDSGLLRFSDGSPYTPSLDFQELRNSQYLGTLA